VYNGKELRLKRHRRLRQKMSGTGDKPRLSVFRSNRYMYAQIIDDTVHTTIVSASTLESDLKNKYKGKVNKDAASIIGAVIAERAIKSNVKHVVFDRGGYKYHGRVKSLADAARKGGLLF